MVVQIQTHSGESLPYDHMLEFITKVWVGNLSFEKCTIIQY